MAEAHELHRMTGHSPLSLFTAAAIHSRKRMSESKVRSWDLTHGRGPVKLDVVTFRQPSIGL
jgi:hypothetical protein